MKTSRWEFVIAFVLVGLVVWPVAAFDGYMIDTKAWLPGSSDNVFSVVDSFSVWPDLLVVRSESDTRLYAVDRTDTLTVAEAQDDLTRLLNQADPYPAEGFSIYGYKTALVSPARTDTIWVDGFKRVFR